MRTLLNWIGAAALAYALVLALLWWQQERLVFLPERLPAGHRFDFGADVHEAWVARPGARLHALHLRLPSPDGVVLYLHGNGGNLDGWFADADVFRRANVDLFMLDYRGYGKSEGRVRSEAELMDDVRAAWRQVAPAYAGKRRIVLGRSLGSALAARLAAEVQPDLTVLVSPFTSGVALAAEIYPFVPGALLRYPLRTDEALTAVRGPVLLVHGTRDEVIPPRHSEQLLAVSPQARLLRVSGAGHNDLQLFATYREGLAAALAVSR